MVFPAMLTLVVLLTPIVRDLNASDIDIAEENFVPTASLSTDRVTDEMIASSDSDCYFTVKSEVT